MKFNKNVFDGFTDYVCFDLYELPIMLKAVFDAGYDPRDVDLNFYSTEYVARVANKPKPEAPKEEPKKEPKAEAKPKAKPEKPKGKATSNKKASKKLNV